jgi:hypothetical protein
VCSETTGQIFSIESTIPLVDSAAQLRDDMRSVSALIDYYFFDFTVLSQAQKSPRSLGKQYLPCLSLQKCCVKRS